MTRADFAFALHHTLVAEGRFSDHEDDAGGATRFGITEDVARRWGYEGDMRLLPKTTAIEIYRAWWWDSLRLPEVRSRFIAAEIFDTAVNMQGPGTRGPAVEIVQSAVTLLGGDPGPVDGAMGPRTIDGVNELLDQYERHLYQALNGYQFARYASLYESDPVRRRSFIRGWMRRLSWFPEMTWAPEPDEPLSPNRRAA